MEIQIHINDNDELKEIDDLGLNKNPKVIYSTLYIRDICVIGFWISSEYNEQTGYKDITFYTTIGQFICDASEENIYKLKNAVGFNNQLNRITIN